MTRGRENKNSWPWQFISPPAAALVERRGRREANVAVPCAPSGLRGGADGGCQAPAHGAGAACPDLGVGDGLSEGPAPRAEERGAASRPEQGECCCRSNAGRWSVGSATGATASLRALAGEHRGLLGRGNRSPGGRCRGRCRPSWTHTDSPSRRPSSRTRPPHSELRPSVAPHLASPRHCRQCRVQAERQEEREVITLTLTLTLTRPRSTSGRRRWRS